VALPPLGTFWKAARAVERVFELEGLLKNELGELSRRVSDVERRLSHIEADRREVVTEARAAAATAASAAASAHLSDLARHVGALQEQMRQVGAAGSPPRSRRRLPPPAKPGD